MWPTYNLRYTFTKIGGMRPNDVTKRMVHGPRCRHFGVTWRRNQWPASKRYVMYRTGRGLRSPSNRWSGDPYKTA